jgi:hypothetical protein
VQPDAQGRLPVLTTVHGEHNTNRVVSDDDWMWVEGGYVYTQAWTQVQGNFHNAPGVVLQPGEYRVRPRYDSDGRHRYLLLSGYWAKP